MKKILYLLVSFVALYSCSGDGIMGGSSLGGKAGELLVVINDEHKNTETSVKATEILNQYEVGLTQSESPFDILLISRNHFSSVFRPHRNILFIEIDAKFSSPQMQFKKDVWTKHQYYIGIGVKNAKMLEEVLTSKHDNIIDFFIKGEIERAADTYNAMPNAIVQKSLKESMNLSVSIPDGYTLNKQVKDFAWISNETKDYSQGVLIYQRPYKDTMQLEKRDLLSYRDSIVKVHIPGPTAGSYMTTEYIEPIQKKVGRYVNNAYTVELRGKWRVENDFMAGPFVSYSFVNTKTKMLVTIEGYVYYPNKSKRNLMRQLQAICQTVSFQPTE